MIAINCIFFPSGAQKTEEFLNIRISNLQK